MFREEKYERYYIFGHFTPRFAACRDTRPQIVIKIPIVLVLRVNLVIFLSFLVNYSYLQVDL